ncbi:MAG: hypothetical protein IKK18_03220 [Clostridia bacterium]|nr:hypothetical protein [Clostridia bacterium]
MNKEELIKYIEDKRLCAMAEYLKTEMGIATQKEVEEAEEDLVANYYDDDYNFIMNCIGNISEHYLEQQEFIYNKAFSDCVELIKKHPSVLKTA